MVTANFWLHREKQDGGVSVLKEAVADAPHSWEGLSPAEDRWSAAGCAEQGQCGSTVTPAFRATSPWQAPGRSCAASPGTVGQGGVGRQLGTSGAHTYEAGDPPGGLLHLPAQEPVPQKGWQDPSLLH